MPCASAAAVMVTKVPKGVTTGLALQCLAPRLERPAFLAISARCSGERTENECAINCDFCFSSLVAHSTLSGEKGRYCLCGPSGVGRPCGHVATSDRATTRTIARM